MAGAGGLIVFGLGAAALLLLGNESSASAAAPVQLPPPTGGSLGLPLANPPKYDRNLPAILQSTVDAELQNDTDPNSLLTFANSLLPDYPIAAAALQARAAQLQAAPNAPTPPVQVTPPPPVTPPPTPPVVVASSGTTTIAPVTIVGTPVTASTPSGDPANGVTNVPWAATMAPPIDVSAAGGIAIPASYTATSDESRDVQGALNTWATTVGFTSADLPLTIDGDYGTATQRVASAFQSWVNATQDPTDPLTIDGLAGSENQAGAATTQSWLKYYLPAGGSFATDGNY